MQGVKLKMALGLPVGALINCADNSGKYINSNFRCQEYLHLRCEESSGLLEQTPCCFSRRYGPLHCQKRKARVKKESFTCRHCKTEETLEKKRGTFHLFPR